MTQPDGATALEVSVYPGLPVPDYWTCEGLDGGSTGTVSALFV
jgi:hypothetical protein